MSDNVKDELHRVLSDADLDEDAIGGYVAMADAAIAHLAERGFLVLGPDGEPIDVRPALRALGLRADEWDHPAIGWSALEALNSWGIEGPLADACLAAAEVEA